MCCCCGCFCVLLTPKNLLFLSSLCPVCLNEEFTDTCAPMELLFNFWNVLYLERKECCLTVWCGSCFTLHWILSSTCILASWMVFFGCMRERWAVRVDVGGWGSDCDLERPSVPVRNPLSSFWPIKYSNAGPPWEPVRFTRKRRWQPEEQWWNHNSVHQPSWDVC